VRRSNFKEVKREWIGVAEALPVQRFKDEVVLSEVNEIEALTSALSGRIWQKIQLLERALDGVK
jgi:hypothetical protein